MKIFDPHITGSLSVSASAEIQGDLIVSGTIYGTAQISGQVQEAVSASHAAEYTLTSSFEAATSSLSSSIAIEKDRVDAILLASDADKDSFKEIVDLINSVDTTNDQAFASFYTSSNDRFDSIETTTSSLDGRLDSVETFTGSINTTIKTKLNTEQVVSGSEFVLNSTSPITQYVDITVTQNGGRYYIDGVQTQIVSLAKGLIYRFDVSDASNAGHPFRLSTTDDGTHGGGSDYTDGVTVVGTEGVDGAYVQIIVNQDTPQTLYYYCVHHGGMGSTIFVGGAGDTDSVNEGSTNLYYTDARVKTKLNTENVISGSEQVILTGTTGYSDLNTRLGSIESFTGSIDDTFATDGDVTNLRNDLNSYTSSNNATNNTQNNRLDSIESFTASIDDTFATDGDVTNLRNDLNVFTSSTEGRLDSLESESGSVRGDLNTYTSSNESTINIIQTQIGSLEIKTGSLDGDVSGINDRLDSLETTSGSHDGRLDSLETTSGSHGGRLDSIESFTASIDDTFATDGDVTNLRNDLNTYTSSNDSRQGTQDGRLNSLETKTGSLDTTNTNQNSRLSALETKTGSLDGDVSGINDRLDSLEVNSGSQAGEIGDLQTFQDTVEAGLEFTGSNVTIKGDLLVKGTETRVDSTTVEISDNIISLNGSGAANAGLEVRDVTAPDTVSGSLLWDGARNYWIGGPKGSEERLLDDSDLTVITGRLGSLETESGSIRTTFNSYTSSNNTTNTNQNSRLGSLETKTGSLEGSVGNIEDRLDSLETTSGSHDGRLDSIESFTASIDDTFATDGDVSNLRDDLNTYTSSNDGRQSTQDGRLNSLETESGSIRTDFNTITSSFDGRLDSIESFTASIDDTFATDGDVTDLRNDLNAYTSSTDGRQSTQDGRLNALETKTGSLDTDITAIDGRLDSLEGATGSYTTTDYYTTGATFNSGDGVITGTRNDGGTWTVDIDGRYLTGYTESDTLDTVADRGNTTNQSLNIGDYISMTSGQPKVRLYENDTTNQNKEIIVSGGRLYIRNLNDNGTAGSNLFNLDGSGNGSFTAGVGATSFVKSGGTSAQFLKADGSVDGSTYLTEHPSVSAATSSDNSGRTYIQDILLDSFGHITGLTTATETVTNTDEYTTGATFNNTSGVLTFTRNDGDQYTVDLSDTLSEITVTGGTYNNSTQTLTLTKSDGNSIDVSGFAVDTDVNWYLTGATFSGGTLTLSVKDYPSSPVTVSLDGRYSLTTHNHDSAYVNVGGDTMTGDLVAPRLYQAQHSTPISNSSYSVEGAVFANANGDENVYPGYGFHKAGVLGLFLYATDKSTLRLRGDNGADQKIWHDGNLTNLNQLTNGPGYITGYTETQTLDAVTDLGSTTTNSINVGGVTTTSTSGPSQMTFFRDENLGTTDTIAQINFQADYQGSPIPYGRIDVGSNSSNVRTDIDFYVKSTSGNLETALKLQGGSAKPKAFFYNSVSAPSFVKDGGTSAQFLMADGSVSTNPGWITGYTNTYLTGATFSTTNGVITFTKNDGNTVTVDIDGKYAEAGHTHNVYDLNNFSSGADPNTYSQSRIWTSYNGATAGNYPSSYNGVVNLGMDASHGMQLSYHYGATDDALYFRHKSDNPSAPNGVGWQGWQVVASRAWVSARGYLTTYNNYYTTGATFNTGNGIITLTRNDGNTVTVDIDGRYAYYAHQTTTNSDFNNIRSSGIYTLDYGGQANANSPDGLAWHALWHARSSGTRQAQITIPYSADNIYYRRAHNATGESWNDWVRIWDDSDFSSTQVTQWDTAYSWGNHGDVGYITGYTDTNYYTTGATLSSNIVTFTRNDGGTYDVNLNALVDVTVTGGTYNDGTATLRLNKSDGNSFDVTGFTIDTNTYITGHTFSGGTLTSTRNNGTTVTVSLDGRYSLTTHTHSSFSDMVTFETALTSNEDWENSPISVLERDNIGNTSTDTKYSPNINFHWSGKVSRSIWMDSTGDFHFGEYTAQGVPGNDGDIYVGGGNSSQWNTAYTYSQVGHLPLAGGTMSGGINMNNNNLTNVNHIQIGDPGAGEGIEWSGGNGFKIYESPNNLTNASGNLQFVVGSTRILTLGSNGESEFTDKLTLTSSTSGSTIFDIQGTSGQLFSITDDLTGDIFAVSDASGVPILNVNADGTVKIDPLGSLYVGNNKVINGSGNIEFDGPVTTTNQGRGIYWTAYDKEGVADASDTAHILHTTNSGGLTGSVLEIKSHNDTTDGVNFVVNGNSGVRINGNIVVHAGNYTSYQQHPTIVAASSSDNSGRTYIQDILLDSNGHVTGITTATETVVNTDTDTDRYVNSASFNTGDGVLTLTRAGSDTATVTVDLDGRYAYSSHDHNRILENATITFGASQLQWMDQSGVGGSGLNGAAPQNPTNDWHHQIIMNHANGAGYYVQMAFDFHDDQVWFQRMENGSLEGWREFIHSGNIGSQSVNYATSAGSATTATSADSATTADQIDGIGFRNTGSNSAINADTLNSNGVTYYTGGVTNFSGNSSDGALYSQVYSSSWQHQIAGDYRSGRIAVRGKNNNSWQSWRKIPCINSTSFSNVSSVTFTHDLGTSACIVQLYDSNGDMFFPSNVRVTSTQVTVTFTTNRTGTLVVTG